MLSGRRKKDYEAQQAGEALAVQAERYGEAPPTEPIAEAAESIDPDDADADEEDEVAEAETAVA